MCFECENDNEADIMSEGHPLCFDCESNMIQFMRTIQEQYDEEYIRHYG